MCKLSKPWSELTREEAESLVKDAESILRAEYYNDVRDLAQEVSDELKQRLTDGEAGEPLREWLIERVHETIDGHQRVIYTWQAQKAVLFSDNDGAYVDDFGDEGLVDEGDINWSRLAHAAMHADVIEAIEALGIDYNDPSSEESKEALGIEEPEEPEAE